MKHLLGFLKLIINELYKTFFQIKTIFFVCLIVFIVGIMAFYSYSTGSEHNWEEEIKNEITKLENSISEKKVKENPSEIELDIINIQEEELKIQKYRLEHKIPETVITPWRFIYNCSSLSSIILLFMAVFSANIVSNEYTGGTIRQILVKPNRRWKIFIAKYASAVISSIILFVVLFVISAIFGFVLFSGNNTSIYDVIITDGNIVERNMISFSVFTYLSGIFSIAIISSLAFLVAEIVRTTGLAIIISVGVYFVGLVGGAFLYDNPFYKFILTPNLSLYQYLPGEALPFEGASLTFSLTICLIYSFVFLSSGLIIFNRRDVY